MGIKLQSNVKTGYKYDSSKFRNNMHKRSIHLASSSTAFFAPASSRSPWIRARRCVCTRKTLTHQKIAQSCSSEHQLHYHGTRLTISDLAHGTVIRRSQIEDHNKRTQDQADVNMDNSVLISQGNIVTYRCNRE